MSNDTRVALFGVLIGIALSLAPMVLFDRLQSEKQSANLYEGLAFEAQSNYDGSATMLKAIDVSHKCAEKVLPPPELQCKIIMVPLDDGTWKSATANATFNAAEERDLLRELRGMYDNIYATNRQEDEIAAFEYLQD